MSEPQPFAYLTRRYWFSASHRLHNDALDDAENERIYGKCNNPHGHGHNYALEVTIAGPVSPRYGMVANLVDIDRAVEEEILAPFAHANLNVLSEHFGGTVPTSENLCIEIHRLLGARWSRDAALAGTRVEKIKLDETRNNTFEYRPGAERRIHA